MNTVRLLILTRDLKKGQLF